MKLFLQLSTALLALTAGASACTRDTYVSIEVEASVFGTSWTLFDRNDNVELTGNNDKPKDPIKAPAGLVGPNVTPGTGKFLCSNRCYRLFVTNTQEDKCPHKVWIDGILAIRYPDSPEERNKCDVDIDFCIDDVAYDTPAPSPFDSDLNRGDDDPFLKIVSANPGKGELDECEGTCRGDGSRCKGKLVCLERNSNSPSVVPGCDGLAKGGEDYCIDARKDSDRLEYIGDSDDYGPYGRCRGDCDNDSDCVGNLECRKRDQGDFRPIPGCEGRPQSSYDYCWDPSVTEEPTPTPTASPTFKPTRRPTRRRPTPRPTKRPTVPTKEDCFVEVKLLTDTYPTENSWQVQRLRNNGQKDLVFAGNGFNVQFRWYNSGQKVPLGRYRYTIFDAAQDGLSGGEYRVLVDGKEVGSGRGDFGADETVDFRCTSSGTSSVNKADEDEDDQDGENSCNFRGQVARSGEWIQGPTHKCKCWLGKWKDCTRTNQ